MAKRLILSDLHFGDPDCSLYSRAVASGLRDLLRSLGSAEELILAGDVLDGNISSLTMAIEGGKATRGSEGWPKQIGFRGWLEHLFADDLFRVNRIVYIPGNHDYIIWNILSTNRAFVEPLSEGVVPTNLPLMEAEFAQPFISGIAPVKLRNIFSVIYPDYSFDLAGRTVMVTHGHYLDEKQTLFKDLEKLIEEEHGNVAKAVRGFFIRTAQYQAAASAVSFVKGTRSTVDTIHKKISSILDIFGSIRNDPIDDEMLSAIEMYLYYFRKKNPDVFIFGHTHEADRKNLSDLKRDKGKSLLKKDVEVWNDGAFLKKPKSKVVGTFVLTDDGEAAGRKVRIGEVDEKGNVKI